MKAQPLKITDKGYTNCEAFEATHLMLNLPGPLTIRILPTSLKNQNAQNWFWNGNCIKPTLTPSIGSRAGKHFCHSFVTDGQVKFLNDCSHEYAGQTLNLLELKD